MRTGKSRKTDKLAAIIRRLDDIHASKGMLLGMLDETKLDLLILALGIGAVNLNEGE